MHVYHCLGSAFLLAYHIFSINYFLFPEEYPLEVPPDDNKLFLSV